MQAVLFWKTWLKKVTMYGCFMLVFVCLLYANALHYAKVIAVNTSFSFVVKKCDNVAVGGFETEQIGGAGYSITVGGATYVAVGVYDSYSVAQNIAQSLGETYLVHTLQANDLYFTTKEQKKNAAIYVGALSSLNGCMQVLSQEIIRLDNGATQNSSRHVVQDLYNQFAYLGETYKNMYPPFSQVCKESANELLLIGEDIIYAQKLRRLQCALSVEYCQLCKEFLP